MIGEFKRNYVNKRNLCNDANRTVIKRFEQKLSRNVKEDMCTRVSTTMLEVSKKKGQSRVIEKYDENVGVIVDDEEAAEVLDKYFSSVFTLEDLGDIQENRQGNVTKCEKIGFYRVILAML